MCLEVPGKSPKALGKNRNLNAADQFMPVVDIENQNPRRIGTAFLLRPIGHAEVEISFGLGLAERERGDRQKTGEEYGEPGHGGIVLFGTVQGQGPLLI